jgi:hypothetical protein
MANPTTNFGWVMPSATDLVTDLPADFDVFGQAVDTDFVGLKGGTTGQVLAKASGTDLDFVWSADAAGMTNPMTTTADIIYSSSGSTPARLGIGSAADVLTVAGGVPTWAAPAGGGKVLQVIQGSLTGAVSSSSSTFADTGLSVTITPTLITSKILILVSANCVSKSAASALTAMKLRLLRDSTEINFYGDTIVYNGLAQQLGAASAQITYLDSPATTSATTYKLQFGSTNNTALVQINTFYSSNTGVSTITVLEIGA